MEVKNIVHGLWIEGALSPLELMTVHSFIHHGYQFWLWSYDIETSHLPENVVLKDAREIIPEEDVFFYHQKNQFGHGQGSYAGFSDIFRYKLLYEYGGWWTDMDITCLKRLPDRYYFFRANKTLSSAIGNLIFCPPQSELMKWCYEKAVSSIRSDNTNWILPVQILNDGIQKFGLQSYIQSVSNRDSWLEVSQLTGHRSIPSGYYCIHWMNEEFRRLKLPKDTFPEKSNLFRIAKGYHVPVKASDNFFERLKFYCKTSRLYYVLINLKYLPAYLSQK